MEKVHLLSLGCPKNLADSELMLGALARGGPAIGGRGMPLAALRRRIARRTARGGYLCRHRQFPRTARIIAAHRKTGAAPDSLYRRGSYPALRRRTANHDRRLLHVLFEDFRGLQP